MRIDAHQHFWIYDPNGYSWIDERMAVLRRDFLPDDLAPLLDVHAIDASIAVQARQSLDETRWLLELAAANSRIAGVVGWVDLCAAEVGAQLEQFAGTQLVGIRHILQDEADDRFCLRPTFRNGIAMLAGRDLVYDVLVYPRQLDAARELVAEFPRQAFVLDHIAKPEIAAGRLAPWSEAIAALAGHENLACKVSGLVTEADWASWRPADFVPYLDAVWNAFGEDRILFGSDWPVCLLASDYASVLEIVTTWAARLPERARAKLFGGNAARIYNLPRTS